MDHNLPTFDPIDRNFKVWCRLIRFTNDSFAFLRTVGLLRYYHCQGVRMARTPRTDQEADATWTAYAALLRKCTSTARTSVVTLHGVGAAVWSINRNLVVSKTAVLTSPRIQVPSSR